MYQLTLKEKEVFDLLIQGLSNVEIERELNLKQTTLQGHLKQIKKKLSVSSRTEAVIFGRHNKDKVIGVARRNPSKKESVIQMNAEGVPITEIATSLEITEAYVRSILFQEEKAKSRKK